MIRTSTATVLLSALLVIVAVAPGAVVAQDDSIWDGFSEDEDEVSITDRISIANAEVAALLDRISYSVSSRTTSDDADARATEYADAFANTFAEHNETLETYTNDRFTGDASQYNVIAFEFVVDDAETTRYLVADVNATDDTFHNSSIVGQTDRSVDYTITLEEYAAKNAADELDYFAEEYAAENRGIDKQLLTRMANRYAGDIELPDEVDWP